MAKFFKRDGASKNSVSSKKFTVNEIDENNFENSSDNDDFIVKVGTSIKKLSLSATSIGSSIRESLKNLNSIIDNEEGDDNKKGTSGTKFSDTDLISFQKVIGEDVKSKIVSTDDFILNEIGKSVDNVIANGANKSSFSKKTDFKFKTNVITPEIDYIETITGKKGVGDKFSSKIVFSIKSNDGIKAFRIFRATSNEQQKNPTLGINALVELVPQSSLSSRKRNDKSFFASAAKFKQNGVDSFLTKTVTTDSLTGLNIGLTKFSGSIKNTNSKSNFKSSDDENNKILSSYVKGIKNVSLDKSVINDLNSIKNLNINTKSKTNTDFYEEVGSSLLNKDTTDRINDAHLINLRDSVGGNNKTKLISSPINDLNFKEIAFLSLDKLKKKSVPGYFEFEHSDVTVEYGKTYYYYIVSVNSDVIESPRSKLVKVFITNNIPPGPPKNLVIKNDNNFVVLNITAGEFEYPIEKFEIYRKEVDGFSDTRNESKNITTISNNDGFIVDKSLRQILKNGFIQIAESLNSKYGGSFFRDVSAVSGKKYVYRVYSVDIFGNKSHEPREAEFFFNERNKRTVDLKKPTILTELDSKTNQIKITISTDDERIVGLFLTRRDLSINQEAFTVPYQPSHIKLGNKLNSKIFDDAVLRSNETKWTGYFSNTNNQDIIFIDQTTRTDHTYQYCVHGIDRFGNKTSFSISQALFVSLRPKINSPVNFRFEKQLDNDEITIKLAWEDGNIEIQSEEKLGNREVLDNNSVRTLYQIERKNQNGELWEQFPLTDLKYLSDSTGKSGQVRERFMPQFLKVDSNYLYRVAAYQTGGFISNFCNPIKVSTFLEIKSPINFRINTVDTKVNPFYVVLNWDDDPSTGTIDKWIIERAVINNFAASKINLSENTLNNLKFEQYKTVYRESSRSISRDLDDFFSDNDKLFSGQHFVVDNDIRFGNTYYYKLYAVGSNQENISNSTYKAISVTDSLFDSKLTSVLTQNEKNKLANNKTILAIKKKVLRSHE